MSDCLYIGIDFGTTFSGVAWAFSRQPENIKIVTKWRTGQSYAMDDAKTPTEIVYNSSRFNKRVVSWGYEVPANQTPLKWFKLCLVDESKLSADIRRSQHLITARQMLADHGLTAVDAAADYLRQLWKYTLESLERELGKTAVNGLPFRVIVTVPACWKDAAMTNTLEAAKKAGIKDHRLCGETTLDLVPEPEAAALATLAQFRGRPDVAPGDVITVCDCGGGTVDVTSYTIQDVNPVQVKESVVGEGKMCGAIFVDQRFEEILRGRLKRRWDNMSTEQIKKVMNNEWEHGIKRSFVNDERSFDVQLPAEATKAGFMHRSKPSSLTLQKQTVQTIFDPVLGQIRQLLLNQIQATEQKSGRKPKCIMLVGGFGRCTYLGEHLKKIFERDEIMVLQPSGDSPWTAICRGAVIKAMNLTGLAGAGGVTVTTRVSKRNYGLSFYEKFIQHHHRDQDRNWVDNEKAFMATNQMRWCLRKGVDISSQDPVRMSFALVTRHAFEIEGGEFKVMIYVSEEDSAPNWKTNDVSAVCSIKIKLTTRFEDLPIHFNNAGEPCRRVAYDIEMTCSGTLLKFAAIVNGVRQPDQNVEASFM